MIRCHKLCKTNPSHQVYFSPLFQPTLASPSGNVCLWASGQEVVTVYKMTPSNARQN